MGYVQWHMHNTAYYHYMMLCYSDWKTPLKISAYAPALHESLKVGLTQVNSAGVRGCEGHMCTMTTCIHTVHVHSRTTST